MKKVLIVLLTLVVLLSLAACGSKPNSASKESTVPIASPEPTPEVQAGQIVPSPGSDPRPEAQASPQPEAQAAPSATVTAPEENRDPDAIDVDLTQLSSTMVYSEVYAMMYEPEQYIGKTVKMRGLFATQEYNGERLYACIVQDATACCAQGLEFETAEKLSYPADYPEAGEEITVIGTFDSYMEEIDGNNYIYLVLKNARFD